MRLGTEGPILLFEPQPGQSLQGSGGDVGEPVPTGESPKITSDNQRSSTGSGTIVRRYIEHYFNKSAEPAHLSEHTIYIRRAFAKVQSQQKRRYVSIVAILILAVFCADGYAVYERWQLQKQRALADDLFYAMKSLDVEIAKLQITVSQSSNVQEAQLVRQYANRRREMEATYDRYLAALHIYDPNMTERRRIILRIARIFGECELDMPSDFEAEVDKYISYWQHTDKLAIAIRTAQEKGYDQTISRELLAQGLPPQFFYLALQESGFDPYASGPVTRKGIAKGMWQFIPETAVKYGLKLGPLLDLRRPDPSDERDQYSKATKAAASYLKDLYSTDAQASGFLVMACYNWGEDRVLPLVRSMPENPRERNFWQLLALHRDKVPRETYDYVFYIVSAAAIGENPRIFGFDFDNPLTNPEDQPHRMN